MFLSLIVLNFSLFNSTSILRLLFILTKISTVLWYYCLFDFISSLLIIVIEVFLGSSSRFKTVIKNSFKILGFLVNILLNIKSLVRGTKFRLANFSIVSPSAS